MSFLDDIPFDDEPSTEQIARQRLRNLDEIGRAEFQVFEGKAFIKNILVDLIHDHIDHTSDQEILRKVPEAIMDVKKAVSKFAIAPSILSIRNDGNLSNEPKKFWIEMVYSKAMVPLYCKTKDEADQLMADILCGKTIKHTPDDHTFYWNGVPFKLMQEIHFPEPSDFDYLTSLPKDQKAIDTSFFEKSFAYDTLLIDGISTQSQLNRFIDARNKVDAVRKAVSDFFDQNETSAWHGVMNYDLSDLDAYTARHVSSDIDCNAELISHYPELFSLKALTLSDLFSSFCNDQHHDYDFDDVDYSTYRDQKFIFYCLGACISPRHDQKILMGKASMYAHLHGLDQKASQEWASRLIQDHNMLEQTLSVLSDFKCVISMPIINEASDFIKQTIRRINREEEIGLSL